MWVGGTRGEQKEGWLRAVEAQRRLWSERPSLGLERWVEKHRAGGKASAKPSRQKEELLWIHRGAKTKATGNSCCSLPSSHHTLHGPLSNPPELDIQFEHHLFREDIPWSPYLNSTLCFFFPLSQPVLFSYHLSQLTSVHVFVYFRM